MPQGNSDKLTAGYHFSQGEEGMRASELMATENTTTKAEAHRLNQNYNDKDRRTLVLSRYQNLNC